MLRANRLSILLLFLAGACTSAAEPERSDASAADAAYADRGADLYAAHCGVCHGEDGRGDGPAAPHLFPPARRFDLGRFRLVSTENGAPTDADLIATLRRGVPGSAMPAWGWLADEELALLAAHVRVLAVRGLARELAARAREEGLPAAPAEALETARAQLTPGRAIEAPRSVPTDAATLEHGRGLFAQHCAACHGPDGRGQRFPAPNPDGTPNWARDLHAGFLKGGGSAPAITARIRAGLPGTAMPALRLAPRDEAALVAYVQRLVPAGAADRLVHRRARLAAVRVASLPAEVGDPAWGAATVIRVVLAPLWWHDDAILAADLAALHDGHELAVRLSWEDTTGEVRPFADVRGSDAAALQLSDAEHPALFGMGSPHRPTNLWHWRALRAEDLAGALDLFDPRVHAGVPGRADVPVYRPALGRLEASDRADRITVRGVGPIAGAASAAGEVRADAHWEAGRWTVVFRRAFADDGHGAVRLQPGSSLQVAVAVWNAAAGDEGARKSISIWQELAIEP
ncbi:MAG: c-type cytochrome [Planctomycetes bacterium]|nr:c-type cytochrome [Planctomycetota bacterium]